MSLSQNLCRNLVSGESEIEYMEYYNSLSYLRSNCCVHVLQLRVNALIQIGCAHIER